MPLFQQDRELPILDPVAWVIAFKLHGEGIRGSQAVSITLQGWAPDESFLYGPSRHVEHDWAKFPQLHRRLVGWGGVQQSHLLIINRWECRCSFQCAKDYYIFKKICHGTLYEFSFLQGSILPLFQRDRELPILDPIAWVIAFKLHGEGIRGLSPPVYRPTGTSARWLFPI